MRICAFHVGHDCSVCVFEGTELVYYKMAERVSRVKHSERIGCLINLLPWKDYDTVILSYYSDDGIITTNQIGNASEAINLIESNLKFLSFKVIQHEHHINHAFSGLYSAGIENATVLVMDGAGSHFNIFDSSTELEIETIYDITNNLPKIVHKRFAHLPNSVVQKHKQSGSIWESQIDWLKELVKKELPTDIIFNGFEHTSSPSVAGNFLLCSVESGFGGFGAGKVMGLAQYKHKEHLLEDKWSSLVDKCNQVQIQSEKRAAELLQIAISKGTHKDIILTGGYALNCVNNTKLLSQLPEGYRLHIDPVCFDAGQSIGAAYKEMVQSIDYSSTKLKSIYIGKVNNTLSHPEKQYADYDIAADYLVDGKIISIFQGNSEAGQRALGNRSILFDPRMQNGKDLVNLIKRRESFRPFGATVLEEHAAEWFDMKGLDCSPYMQFALPVKNSQIPAVTHVDGTCRIQTVNPEQNLHLYNLIKRFYEKTGVPILGNTSFNLAGEPLVETIDDAVKTFYNAKNNRLFCIFLPESNEMIQ